MSKVTLEELKQHCIKTIEACEQIKRIPIVRITDDRRSQEHKLVLQLIEEHEQRQSTDAVSREAVLDIVNNPLNIRLDEIIKKLPPVTPERPKGEWIDEVNDFGEIRAFHCSECYEKTGFFTNCKSRFCPNCGADMRGVSECSEENKN